MADEYNSNSITKLTRGTFKIKNYRFQSCIVESRISEEPPGTTNFTQEWEIGGNWTTVSYRGGLNPYGLEAKNTHIQVWLRRGTINQWGTPVVCWHVLSILDQYWYWERRPTEFHNPTDENYNWIDGIHIEHIEMRKGTIPASVVGLWGERTINPAHQLIFYQYQPIVGPATLVEQNPWSRDPDLPHNRIGEISSALSLSKILKLHPHMNWILTCRTVFLGSVILQLQSDVE